MIFMSTKLKIKEVSEELSSVETFFRMNSEKLSPIVSEELSSVETIGINLR